MGADYLFTWGSKNVHTSLTFCLYKYYLERDLLYYSVFSLINDDQKPETINKLSEWETWRCKSAGRPQAPGRWNHMKNVWCTTYFSSLCYQNITFSVHKVQEKVMDNTIELQRIILLFWCSVKFLQEFTECLLSCVLELGYAKLHTLLQCGYYQRAQPKLSIQQGYTAGQREAWRKLH